MIKWWTFGNVVIYLWDPYTGEEYLDQLSNFRLEFFS
jgi:hypothetical protein